MIKRLKYIIIPLLAFFLMSHNSYAAVSTYDLNNFTIVASSYRVPLYCKFDGNTSITDSSACTFNSNGSHTLTDIRSNGLTWQFKKGDIVEFDVAVYTPAQLSSVNPVLYVGNGSTYNNLLIFDVTEKVSDDFNNFLYFNPNDNSIGQLNFYGHMYHFSSQVLNNFSGEVGLSGNDNFPIFLFDDEAGQPLYFRISNLLLWRKNTSNSINNEQKQETQNAANNSSTAGNSSQSDATSATSSLLSVIGSGIGAITSATPSNCKINGNMGNLDMGQIDLCANPVPTFVAVIGSFIAVALVLPLVIILFNRFISIIRSFQS